MVVAWYALNVTRSRNALDFAAALLQLRVKPSAGYTVVSVQAVEHPRVRPDKLRLISGTVEKHGLYDKSAASS